MTTIGYTDVREELRITPAKVERILYKQEVAVCPECRKDGDGTLVKAATPTALFPHSPASASIVAYVMYHKTFVGTPYYRQESGMFQLGLKLPRETMANWCIQGAGKYFYPLFERMHELLIQRDLIHADETTCQVLREEGKAAESISYMWIYLSGNDGLPPIILYDYQAGRAGRYAQQFLEGFHGMLQCDGYQGYNKVDNVLLVCCLAHCRRKFYEAIPAERRKKLKLLDINSEEEIKEPLLPKKEEIPGMIPAEVGLAYCNKLFFLEKQFRDLTPEERKDRRQETEMPVWESFYAWLEQLNPVKRSKLEKAEYYRYFWFFRNHPFYPFDNISFAANSSLPQRPYMVRFIIFNLLFVPSTKPFDKGLATAFSTADKSFSSPEAKRESSLRSLFLYFSINRYKQGMLFR